MAEKILQANRQALEAEKLTGSAAESFLGGFDPVGVRVRAPGLGSRPEESDVEAEESDVDVEMEKVRYELCSEKVCLSGFPTRSDTNWAMGSRSWLEA